MVGFREDHGFPFLPQTECFEWWVLGSLGTDRRDFDGNMHRGLPINADIGNFLLDIIKYLSKFGIQSVTNERAAQ
jgi:hypothetical protein